MCALIKRAAHNLAVLKHLTLNLIRLDPIKRKDWIKARRLISATSDTYPNISSVLSDNQRSSPDITKHNHIVIEKTKHLLIRQNKRNKVVMQHG